MKLRLFNTNEATFNDANYVVPSFVLKTEHFKKGVQEAYNHIVSEALDNKVASTLKALETGRKNNVDSDTLEKLEYDYNEAVDTRKAFRDEVKVITMDYDNPSFIYCFAMLKSSNDFEVRDYHGVTGKELIDMIVKHMSVYADDMGATWTDEHKKSFSYVKGKLNDFIEEMFDIKSILASQRMVIEADMKDATREEIEKACKSARYYKPVSCKLSTASTLRVMFRVYGEYKTTSNKNKLYGLKFKGMTEAQAFSFIMREVLAVNGCTLTKESKTFTI